MTDQSTPTDDELSLALDGEADAALLARIDASPEATARLEQLRTVSRRVAASAGPPLDDDLVEELIDTALDTPIAPTRPSVGGRGPTPWLVAAAVILLMAVGLSLVWAGRGVENDQASASFDAVGNSISAESESGGAASADSSFQGPEKASTADSSGDRVNGSQDAPTSNADRLPAAEVPAIFLGAFPDGESLRSATAESLAAARSRSGSIATYESSAPTPAGGSESSETGANVDAPSAAALERCGDQLQVTLRLEAGPIQTGYAQVDDQLVLVYEFAAASAVDSTQTTLVAAVGADACDEVVIFER